MHHRGTDSRGYALHETIRRTYVGRRRERAELLTALHDAAEGSPGIAVLTGEPGIGKTHTARWISNQAEEAGFHCLSTAADQELVTSFALWRPALRRACRIIHDNSSAAALSPFELRQLRAFTEGGVQTGRNEQPTEGWPVQSRGIGGTQQRDFLISAGVAALTAASRIESLCIVLEDLHWAGLGELIMYRRLVTAAETGSLLLVGTCRDYEGQSNTELLRCLAEINKHPGGRILSLGPLSHTESEELFRLLAKREKDDEATVGFPTRAGDARTPVRSAGGNPLLIVELARDLDNATATEGLSQGIRATVAARLSVVSETARETIRLAAVLGETFDWDVLRRAYGEAGIEHLVESVDELVRAGLLGEGGTGPGLHDEDGMPEESATWNDSAGVYQFRHGLVRDAVLKELSPTKIAAEHARIARRLAEYAETSPEAERRRVARVQHHALQCGRLVEAELLFEYSVSHALNCLHSYAPEQAVAAIDAARDRHLFSALQSARLAHLRAIACTEQLRHKEAAQSLEQAFDLYMDAGMPEKAAEVALTTAHEYVDFGVARFWINTMRGLSSLRARALRNLPKDSAQHLRLLAQADDRESRVATLERARSMEDEDLELFVAARLAYYDALNLDCENAERLISRSLEICRKRGPRVEHFMALYARTCCAGVCGTPREEHDRIRDELRRYAEESGTSHEYGMYQRVEATLQLRRGEWEAARRTAREMLAHVERPAEEFRGREAGAVLVGAALDTGEIDTARSYLRDIFRIPERAIDYSPRMALWNAVYRRPVNGLANLARSSTTSWNIGAPYVYVNSGLAYEARSARLLADEAACRRILRRALRWRGSLSLGATTAELACVDTLCGELTLFLGDTEDAIPHFEQADGILRRAGLGPHIAWNLMQLGLALATSGRTDRATRTFREAYKRAEELEMRPLMKLVADASVNASSVAAAGGDPLPDGLSSREAEVLSLVAEGYTNQEIGERLCISPHTVARHIHAVLDKTGMANRTEAGAYAVRHGLTR